MQEEYVTLKWGDIVRIHGVNISKKNERKGLIISKGFTDTNIYYQIYNEFSDVNFYRESLFQVIPRVNFDLHDQLLDGNLMEDVRENLRIRSKGEIDLLESSLVAKAGKEIKYGSEIIFRHIESKSYLKGMMQAASAGQGAFKIEVSPNLSSFVIFKLVSPRTFQNQNDKIYFNDALQIYHPSSDSYMNFSQTDETIALDIQYGSEVYQAEKCSKFISQRPSIKTPKDIRQFIINENKSKCLWKFIEHCSYEEYINKEKIKSHDIVYFKHTKKQEESFVSTTISQPLVSYLKQNEGGNLSYECFWELIPKEVNELGPENCNVFWARSIVTGQFLEFGEGDNPFKIQIQQSGKSESKGFDNRGFVHLICSTSKDGEVNKLQRSVQIGLEEDLPQIQKKYECKNKKFSFQAVTVLPKDIFMIYKVAEEDLRDAMYVMSAHEPLVKFIQKLSSQLIKLQMKHQMNYFHFFKAFNENELANIVKIEKMLAGKIYDTDYDNIVASGTVPNRTIQNILVQTGIVQILIEIIHNIFDAFRFVQKNINDPSQDRALRVKVTEIFEQTYILIEKTAANFEDNRIYVSRWMDLFLQHSNNVNKSYIQECLVGILDNNPVAIQDTINEEKIKGLIENFLRETKESEGLTTKYLRLFSTFIKCENEVIKDNQNIILNSFFKNPENHLNFRFKVEYKNDGGFDDENDPFKVKSKETLIAFGRQAFMTFNQFFEEHSNKWNYLLAYVNLLADICINRNIHAIENVSQILSLQAVAVVLVDSEIEDINSKIKEINKQASLKSNNEKVYPIENLHEPFIRIAHYVYVDNHKFQQIKRIKRISQWHKDPEQQNTLGFQDINRTKRVFEGEKEEEEERYLQSILEYIKTYIRGGEQSSNLQMLYTVLSLLKSTVILGLWRGIKFFRELAPELMLKITKIDNSLFFERNPKSRSHLANIESNKEKLKMNRPEITLSIQCKIKAIEIFKFMNDLEIDIRIRYIMNFFKGLYECTENFNIYDFPLEEQVQDDANEEEIDRNQVARSEYLKMQGKALLGDNVKKMSQDVDVILKQNVWLNKLRELTPFQFSKQDDPMKDRYIFQGDLIDFQREGYEDEINQQFKTIVLGLFELSAFGNYKLLNSSLIMLKTMFQQRKDLIANFKKILICGKGNLEEVYLTLKFMREKFQMLANTNIEKYEGDSDKSFPYEIKKPYDYLIKDREKRSGIVEDLFFLARTLKDGTSLKNIESLMLVEDDVFNVDQVYNFINEKQKNNKLFQSLNLAEGIYKPLLQYIKIIKGTPVLGQNHRKLLLSIYQYLTLLCFNNLQAKQILMPYIPYVLPHLQVKVGAASFLYEVCRNNKLLVSNEELVKLIIEKCLQSCLKLEQGQALSQQFSLRLNLPVLDNDFQKSRIFFALRGILLFNEQGHKRNQQLLMNRLQDNRYSKFIFQDTIIKKPCVAQFNLSPRQTFISYHFQLFSVLVESGNLINIGKLENLHPYQYCLECLENASSWEMRRSLRAYINRLYYVNKDKDIFLFEKFISKEFTILNNQLADLIELHKKKLLSEDLKIKNGIRFSFAQSQIFLFIIQSLITIHEMFLKKEFIAILRRQLAKDERLKEAKPPQPLHESFIRLYKNLGCIFKIYKDVKPIDPFIREIQKLLDEELMKFHVRYLEKKTEPEDNKNKSEEQEALVLDSNNNNPNTSVDIEKKNFSYDHSKSFFRNLAEMIKFVKKKEKMDQLKENFLETKKKVAKENQMKKAYLQTIFEVENEKLKKYYTKKAEKKQLQYDPHLQTANSRIFKVLAKPELGENEQNIELNKNLQAVKAMIEDSPTFDKFKDDEFIFLVNKLTSLNEISIDQYQQNYDEIDEDARPVISINEIFANIFKLIMENPDKIDDQQKIFVIKLVRCFITESVEGKQSYKLPIDKWDADYCGEDEKFSERQKQIQQCGGSNFIISIFKENLTNRIELLNEALLLGIAYLYGGNSSCQNSILESLKKDQDNVMLTNMKGITKTLGDFLINIRRIKQGKKRRDYIYNIADTYDYFNPDEKVLVKYFSQSKIDKFQVQIELDSEKALCRTFRFLQLFCENNNKDMKKFLSTQTNEDLTPKPNSINFIDEACILLKKVFKIMNNKLVMIPNPILAFIGEVTQVPILENQKSFMKSTFFQDISYMVTFFDSIENKLQRKFNAIAEQSDDPLNALSEIYQQAVQLALGNFQGNEDSIMYQFLNKCQPQFLWLIVRDQLWKLIKQKYSAILEKIEKRPNERQKETLTESQGESERQRKTLSKMTSSDLLEIIAEQKKQKTFEGSILNIISVLIILQKINTYSKAKTDSGLKDKENTPADVIQQGLKGTQFFNKFIEIANKYLNKKDNEKEREKERQRLKRQKKQNEIPIEIQKILAIFNSLILQIQIKCENQEGKTPKLQKIYFPNHPVFDYMAATTRDKIMAEVQRQTPRDKLTSLLEFKEEIYDEIDWNFQMNFYTIPYKVLGFEGTKNVSITSQLCEQVRWTASICSYIIIALMFWLVLADHDVNPQITTYFTYDNWKSRFLIKMLCSIQLFLMIFYALLWYVLHGELAYRNLMNEQSPKEEENLCECEEVKQFGINELIAECAQQKNDKKDNQNMKVLQKVKRIGLTKLSELLKILKQNKYISKLIFSLGAKCQYFYKTIYLRFITAFSSSDFKSILLFLIASIMGNFVGVEWYTIYLFNLFVGVPNLINVFKAIILNINQLILLSVLAGLFVLVFNILSLNTYTPVIYEDDLPEGSCESILNCVLVVYTSGAINDDMEIFDAPRFLFDLLYVVFMELLFQNLVGSIIIDAYTSLTSEDKQRAIDKKSKCYICSSSKQNIQKSGDVMENHILKHYIWNYIYYIYCLKNKDSTDYTGIEYIIYNKIEEDDVTWFPVEDSGSSSNSKQQVEQEIKSLRTKLDKMWETERGSLLWVRQKMEEVTKAKKKVASVSSSEFEILQ